MDFASAPERLMNPHLDRWHDEVIDDDRLIAWLHRLGYPLVPRFVEVWDY